jgi:erythromycin esterase-like protein/ADP-ribose pyrophosphatase YjhB (NUDIX family)
MTLPASLRYTLCFLTRGDRVLLLKRRRPPNQGLWNGVGGHLEPGEHPLAACLREVREETGYVLRHARFGGVLTWRGFEVLEGGLYLFTVEAPSGEAGACDEGVLQWHPWTWLFTSPEVVSNLHVVGPSSAARRHRNTILNTPPARSSRRPCARGRGEVWAGLFRLGPVGGTMVPVKIFRSAVLMTLLAVSCTVPGPHTSPVAPLATVSTASAVSPEPGSAVQWLKANAIPFDTPQSAGTFNDLMPHKELIGPARLVALGEATHGTHEFFQVKQRLVQFLVEEMGFNTVALEANWPEVNRLNAYVHTGQGDPAELLKALGMFDTQELLDLIEWMRVYDENPRHTSKISFYGFDMQSDQLARDTIAAYLGNVDPSAARQVADDYDCYPEASPACQQKLQAAYDLLDRRQVDYIAQSSPEAFAEALQSARLVVQQSDYASHNNNGPVRDRYLAENVEWLLEQAGPDAKMVLWAHNGHVSVSRDESLQSMGYYLRQRYGQQLVVFGLLFYEGSFNAFGVSHLQTFQVEPPPSDSCEAFFHQAALPYFILDLRRLPTSSPAADWLLTPHPFRAIGSMYNPNDVALGFETAALAKVFDAVIYFQDTSPSHVMSK